MRLSVDNRQGQGKVAQLIVGDGELAVYFVDVPEPRRIPLQDLRRLVVNTVDPSEVHVWIDTVDPVVAPGA